MSYTFHRAALNAGRSIHDKAVRLSVRLSVKRMVVYRPSGFITIEFEDSMR